MSVELSSKHSRRTGKGLSALLVSLIAAMFVLTATPGEAHAENLIKRPGAHNNYKFEIEPQLAFNTDCCATWFGPGVRASIPFMHNGPIDTINNNMAITFGLNTLFRNNSGGMVIRIPVAAQWNFYFTDIISVVAEAGLSHDIWTGFGDSFDIDPLFAGGGRFQFGKVGVIVRVGYPSVSVGANFQF